KKRLAEKLTDGAMLVAALRFYSHILSPGELVRAEDIHVHTKSKPRRWRVSLEAARRVLGIQYHENRTAIQLPDNYQKRLRRIGLCQNPAAAAQFQRLSPNLEIDASTQVFADTRPH